MFFKMWRQQRQAVTGVVQAKYTSTSGHRDFICFLNIEECSAPEFPAGHVMVSSHYKAPTLQLGQQERARISLSSSSAQSNVMSLALGRKGGYGSKGVRLQ
jgi:hypothetical protein